MAILCSCNPKKAIPFIKAGEKPQVRSQLTTGLLHKASDWQLQLIILELTVPWEERIEEANERKRAKYQELVEETIYEPIEVGCRGFAGRSLCKALSWLGVTGVAKKRAIRSASEAAEKATRWLWIKRADP
ncbi:hypothetical protein M9458_007719, partial [Cirrhinus mrigala]